MMKTTALRVAAGACAALLLSGTSFAQNDPQAPALRGTFRYASPPIKADVSPPLRSMRVIAPDDFNSVFAGALLVDPDPIGRKLNFSADDRDPVVQRSSGPALTIPAPALAFNAGSGTANPPDPVGDVGLAHYVRMSNATFQIFNKTTGASVFGPANINTLFQGFGADCELENAGDPIVLYDQFANRWLLSQFSNGTGPNFFNCVAVSTTSDPLGTWQRYAFPAAVFPDYPKYGIWPTATNSAYLITTRELDSNAIGVYAIDRAAILSGSLTPTVISFINQLTPTAARFLGDGLLPADVDGNAVPPAGSPAYFVGSMDDGGPYGATQDALSLWRFNINFAAPATSTFVLYGAIPIAPYDTIYPCVGRSCVPQPPPGGAVDILSYRQRPLHRAAYRNFGSYETIVTNQSVEAATGMAGIRWWELRNPGGTPLLVQDSTYAPGVTDGVQRWMGSIAQDRNGAMALGYSASSTTVFPSVRYTGRLESDPLNTMPQGEGEFIAGTGVHTAATRRWGDYTSMNVDPVDDCTFWYVNEYFATNSTTWTLRVGSFKFPECGQPNFGITVTPLSQDVCTPNNATFNVQASAYSGFSGAATLAATGNPATTTVSFAPATIAAVPGSSTLTIGNTGAVPAGTYTVNVSSTGGSPAALRERSATVNIVTQTPGPPTPVSPANAAENLSIVPTLSWSTLAGSRASLVEIATDSAFTNIVATSPASTATTFTPSTPLAYGTQFFWRVRAANICGDGANSAVFSFRTRPAPATCAAGTDLITVFSDNTESGTNGWTVSPASGTTWTLSTLNPSSGTTSWLAADVVTPSDQLLTSPAIPLPAALSRLQLRFRHEVNMEPNGAACFDGGFVEVSTNGTTFTPVAGSDVIEDLYDGQLASGVAAWCGEAPYANATVDLASLAGQTVNLRFHLQTDNGVGFAPDGWFVDDIQVLGCGDTFANGFSNGFE
jgi:hypothetical protein